MNGAKTEVSHLCGLQCIHASWSQICYQIPFIRPRRQQHEQRWLPPSPCPLIIALVPLKCSGRNLQFPHRVPFGKEKRVGALALSKTKHTGLCLVTNALSNAISRNLQTPHTVPFTKEKMPWCPRPFKNRAYTYVQARIIYPASRYMVLPQTKFQWVM